MKEKATALGKHTQELAARRAEQKEMLQLSYLGDAAKSMCKKPTTSKARKRYEVSSSNQNLQSLFDQIVAEIEERKAFLQKLESLGQAEEHRSKIMKEIKDRKDELTLLNNMLSE